jgi:hypothetical protein
MKLKRIVTGIFVLVLFYGIRIFSSVEDEFTEQRLRANRPMNNLQEIKDDTPSSNIRQEMEKDSSQKTRDDDFSYVLVKDKETGEKVEFHMGDKEHRAIDTNQYEIMETSDFPITKAAPVPYNLRKN